MRLVSLGILFVTVAVGSGCGSKVMVPPRIDLQQHEILAIIEFASSEEGELGPLATKRFMEAARRDQGLVRIVEIGPEAEALRRAGADRLDQDAFRALGSEYGVNTIFTGELVVSDVRPDVRVTPDLRDVGLAAEVDATLAVQMTETVTGASLWNNSADVTMRVGQVRVFGGRQVVFDADDPERAYGELISALVGAVTRDFRVTWERR